MKMSKELQDYGEYYYITVQLSFTKKQTLPVAVVHHRLPCGK